MSRDLLLPQVECNGENEENQREHNQKPKGRLRIQLQPQMDQEFEKTHRTF